MEDLGGNLPADPLFASAPSSENAPSTTFDLRLLEGSPVLNSGDASLLPPDSLDLDGDSDLSEALPVDLQGQTRVQGETVILARLKVRFLTLSLLHLQLWKLQRRANRSRSIGLQSPKMTSTGTTSTARIHRSSALKKRRV